MKYYLAFLFLILLISASDNQAQSAGKISGILFMDYYYNAARDTGIATLPNTALSGQRDANGFDLRRAYLTYDYMISESFSTRFRLEADGRALTDNKRFGVFVKDAFIRWKEILPGQEIILGIQPPPAYEISESYYGFRSLEKTIMDVRGIVSSRDFGLAVKGRITGNINYWLLFGNNSSTSPESDRYKRLYGHISIKPVHNLTATFYGDVRFRPKTTNTLSGDLIDNNIITAAVFLGYTDSRYFSVGAESFLQMARNGLIRNSGIEDLNGLGISTFAWFRLNELLTCTLRYDYFDPGVNKDLQYDSRNYIIAGLSYRPVDKVSIIPNILIETFESLPGRGIDASVTPRITLSYEFL